MLQAVAEHYGFDLTKPLNTLDKKHLDIVLNGSKGTAINFKYINERGDIMQRKHPFEGVIPNMERRYKDTESNAVREELSKYLSQQPCSACHGSRLRLEARNVFVGNTSLPSIATMSIENSLKFLMTLICRAKKRQSLKKILKEIQDRLNFLVNVGLNYLTLERSADTLSGGEAQRIRLASQSVPVLWA